MVRSLAIASAALASLAAPAVAQSSDRPASIPFVSFGNIDDFHADGDRGVWLRNRQHKWFYATMVGPCLGLPFAQRIGADRTYFVHISHKLGLHREVENELPPNIRLGYDGLQLKI